MAKELYSLFASQPAAQCVTDEKIETPEYEQAVNVYIEEGINHDCKAIKELEKSGILEQFVFDTWYYAVKWERERKKGKG